MKEVSINKEEVQEIKNLLIDIQNEYDNPTSELFLEKAEFFAMKLPEKILNVITTLKNSLEAVGCLVIKNLILEEFEPTPASFGVQTNLGKSDFLHILFSCLLGEPFGWTNQSKGRLIHDIYPVKEDAEEQYPSSSKVELEWHTEDAFHDSRADFVSLFCVRNFEKCDTTYFSIRDIQLDNALEKELRRTAYIIKPYEYIPKWKDKYVPILFGDLNNPFIRLDPLYMGTALDKKAQEAQERIINIVNNSMKTFCLQQGDFCIFDNFKVVHGRKPFNPSYDGKHRWLKRINTTSSLNGSGRYINQKNQQ